MIGHLGGEENNGDESKQPAELIDEKWNEVQIIVDRYRFQWGFHFDEIVDLLYRIENHDDYDNQNDGKDIGPQEFLGDVAIKYFEAWKFHRFFQPIDSVDVPV